MKLNYLIEVVAIMEQGSIRAAARMLNLSQPALTRNLADLERELGYRSSSGGLAGSSRPRWEPYSFAVLLPSCRSCGEPATR